MPKAMTSPAGRFSLPILFTLAACLSLFACAARPGHVRDLDVLAQDAGAYYAPLPADAPLVTPEAQAEWVSTFRRTHFAPWHQARPSLAVDKALWGIQTYEKKALYGENTLLRDPEFMAEMRRLARPEAYPALVARAVSIADSDLRTLPTDLPAFYAFDKPGEGYPFDYGQDSRIPAGTPLLVTHASADNAWYFVESRVSSGWLAAGDLALVDETFMAAWEARPLAAVLTDDLGLSDDAGRFRCLARIGTVLPLAENQPGGGLARLLVPARDADGRAVVREVAAPAAAVSRLPLPATPANFARLANVMLGRPYGWGGLYGDRDCSALIQDLYAPFGRALPRNSSQQAKAGRAIPLAGLDAEAREALITAEGLPFLSLLAKPGHIMLYLGVDPGSRRPAVLHAVWGVKTRLVGREGRFVLGRAVVTTLTPGDELWNLARPDGLLVNTLTALVRLDQAPLSPAEHK